MRGRSKDGFMVMLEAMARSREIEERAVPPHHDGSPCIEIMRLERRDDPRVGAFAGGGFFDNNTLMRPAEDWAELHDPKHNPGRLPNIMEDGDEMARHWTLMHFAGWSSFKQLDMWLPVREMRAAVYERPEACCRLYRIAKDRVLFGKHQVGFLLDYAEPLRHLSREEFIR